MLTSMGNTLVTTALVNWDEMLREVEELPTVPAIASRILETVGHPDLCIQDLEAVVLRDPALTTKVLRLANSTLFGASGRISTMGHALARLDIHVARLIVLSFELSPLSGQIDGFNHHRYWKRSSAVALISARLARHFPEVNIDEARVAGLLSGMGRLLLAESLGGQYGEICLAASRRGEPLDMVERHHIGTDHATVAGRILSHWHFPQSLVNAIQAHLQPKMIGELSEHPRELAKVLHVSSLIADVLVDGQAEKMASLRVWCELWARLDEEMTQFFIDSLRAEVREVQRDLENHERDEDELLAQAHKMMVEVSLATATNLSLTAQKVEESQQRVEDLRKERDRLAQQVTTDPLTGIFNRKFFDQRLSEEIKRFQRHQKPLSLILLDLDHFKKLNDTYGHQAGDAVLKTATRTIRKCLRSSDVVARYGGEEFAVIAPETDHQGAVAFAERMRVCLERLKVVHNGHRLAISASFGVVTATDPSKVQTPEKLIDISDGCLYESKRAGRNCVHGSVL